MWCEGIMPDLPYKHTRGELAQWLEQRNHNPLVPSSNLGFATTLNGLVFSPVHFLFVSPSCLFHSASRADICESMLAASSGHACYIEFVSWFFHRKPDAI